MVQALAATPLIVSAVSAIGASAVRNWTALDPKTRKLTFYILGGTAVLVGGRYVYRNIQKNNLLKQADNEIVQQAMGFMQGMDPYGMFGLGTDEKLIMNTAAEVEKIVNEQIEKDWPMGWREEDTKEALANGVMGAFGDRYGDKVKVYTVGDPDGENYSREICGGPHVEHTGLLKEGDKHFKILKEEASSAGSSRRLCRTHPRPQFYFKPPTRGILFCLPHSLS
jgi:hypothetical protein